MTKEKFTSISLQEEMQRSYLEYAMSVIVGRALPDARDGLKPVQRRILFAMHELGLTPDRPFRKCARVVGDVLGKYHPHGDQAVYEALVRLVQDFSTKYPTLDGHGNFGSVDNDPPAAMRYTETRLAPIAHECFLQEIETDTVSYSNNFDGSQKEPDILPAQLPFLLLNGSSGIAVGMATNIPPHNLGEIIDGLIALIRDKDISDSKLSKIILGPDFPTGGELLYNNGIKNVYLEGRGSITIRGVIKSEEINLGKGKHKRNALIISELPYQISKAGWIEKLAELVNIGKIDGISDIRDESDRDGMRIVIELKKDSNPEIVISNLYKKTTLQSNFGAILLALVNGKPVQLTLRKYLNYFLEFREETIRKRTKYFLKIASEKLEILEGFSIATKNIKNIIEIIQNSENVSEAKSILIPKLDLSNKQADAVLSMPLKKLTNLEKKQVENEINQLFEKKKYLSTLLNNRSLLLETLIKELIELKKKFNVKRKTKILKDINQSEELDTINNQILEDLIIKDAKISIDNRFYFKKLIYYNYKKLLDQENKFIENKNVQKFICNIKKSLRIIGVTSSGKVLQINWKSIINNVYKLDNKILGNINPKEIINFHDLDSNLENYICIICSDGKFKKVLLDKDMIRSTRIFSITKLKNSTKIIDSFIYSQEENIIILTSIGRIFKFNLSNEYLKPSSKQSQGILLVNLLPKEQIVSCCKSKEKDLLYLISNKGKFFELKINEVYNSYNSKLGYINEKIQLNNDHFIKVLTNNQYIDFETNKNKSARINLTKFSSKPNKNILNVDFLNLEKDEFLENCSSLDNLLN
ncbi:DNA gyrase/topoisomerase IV, subunit A [Prochlorococcus marinus str. MIT 9515]|uniref:DNA topoisomerase (ATP-hydrolyzing) n=1 Tax=Prochlorococcus marinus (strain MIT 9515) TaxID=167542 RepID=A2BTW1_PROM5|nr:DNA topoisomerase (ATP-hydrolyzing) [Prochlorococcus marinus]ABM71213.1 DNA gyrase/topoisomerase IV, subunit A [Prochlorococcus marinus str. MIT 9515]